jgi:hypothetical protein
MKMSYVLSDYFLRLEKNILGVIVVIAVVVLQRCKGYQL